MPELNPQDESLGVTTRLDYAATETPEPVADGEPLWLRHVNYYAMARAGPPQWADGQAVSMLPAEETAEHLHAERQGAQIVAALAVATYGRPAPPSLPPLSDPPSDHRGIRLDITALWAFVRRLIRR